MHIYIYIQNISTGDVFSMWNRAGNGFNMLVSDTCKPKSLKQQDLTMIGGPSSWGSRGLGFRV